MIQKQAKKEKEKTKKKKTKQKRTKTKNNNELEFEHVHLVLSTDIDECASQPCKNNATCTDRVDGYNCICPPSFSGTQCELNVSMPSVKGLC